MAIGGASVVGMYASVDVHSADGIMVTAGTGMAYHIRRCLGLHLLLRGHQAHGQPQDTVPSRLAPCCSCSGRRATIQACRSSRSFAASRCAIAPSATSIRKIAAPSVAPLTVSPRTPQLHSTGRASQRQRRSTRLQHHRARRHHQSRELQIHRGSLHPPAEFLIELHRLAKSTTKYLRTQLQEINPRRVYPA